MEIVPIDPLFNPDDHFCATPGHTAAVGGETRTTSCCYRLAYSKSPPFRSALLFNGIAWVVLGLGSGGEGGIALAERS